MKAWKASVRSDSTVVPKEDREALIEILKMLVKSWKYS